MLRRLLAIGMAAGTVAFAMRSGAEAPPLDEQIADAVFGGEDGGPVSYDECVEQAGGDAAARVICAALVGGGDDPSVESDEVTGPTHYIEMSDGVLIAVTIAFPADFDPADPGARRYPAILEMSGYESGSEDGRTPIGDLEDVTGLESPVGLTGGTRASHEDFYGPSRYVSVTANVRGTGCSSGEFDLFSVRSAIDGVEVIEWIAAQPWSNGRIGIFGHSYSGITGAMVASFASQVNEPKLDAVSVSGLIGDIYRDIVYPGGVTNYGFPLLWTGGVRLLYDVGGGSIAGILADRWDRQCLRNQAKRSRTVLNDPILQGSSDTDNTWFQERSLVSYVDRITAPIHVTTAYQDEQTGPRGGTNVFDHLSPTTVKRLVMLNGDHGSQTGPEEVRKERKAWLDYWLLDPADRRETLPVDPGLPGNETTVRVLLEVHNPGRVSNGTIDSTSFPLAETEWTELHFHGDASMSEAAPAADGGSSTYLHGSKRQAYSHMLGSNEGAFLTAPDGPDELRFATVPVEDTWVISGPITATLFLSATAVDTELQIQLIDEGPGGELTYLQRGLLRASHRAIDPSRSRFFTDANGVGRLWRPWRPHTNPELLVPGEIYEYLVEVFPVSHVFHPGHRLVVKIHAPALDDNDYVYIPKTLPSVNTLHHDADHPSRILLPVIPADASGVVVGPPTEPCADDRMRCVTP